MTAPQRPDVDPYDGPPPTDLVVEDITVGDGPEAVSGQTVTVHYVGVAHSTGEEFDASWNRGAPFRFPLGAGRVIARLGPGRGRHEGRRPAKAGDPAAPGLRRPRRGRCDQAGRDPGLRRGPAGRELTGGGDRGLSHGRRCLAKFPGLVCLEWQRDRDRQTKPCIPSHVTRSRCCGVGNTLQLVLTSDTHLPRRAHGPAGPGVGGDRRGRRGRARRRLGGRSDCSTRSRSERRGWWACAATTTAPRCGRGCPRSPGSSWPVSGSPWCTRPGPRPGGSAGAPPRTPTSTCSSSGTATSPGTRPRPAPTAPLRLLNPGSPTDRRRQPTYTWMTAEVGDGALAGVTLHHLPPRRPPSGT